jgi:hypothetical protein
MIDNEYMLAWAAYAVAGLGCLLVWCLLTDWMWRWLREPLRLIVAVLLFTPTVVDPGKDAMAPAVAIAAMDLLLKVGDNAWRAVADLSSYLLVAFAVYFVLVIIRWPIESALKRRRAPKSKSKAKATEPEPALLREVDEGNTWVDENGDRRLRVEPRI